MDLDVKLESYATPTQWSYYEATCRLGNMNKASIELGVHSATINSAIKRIKLMAAARGYSPEHDLKQPGAEGFHLKGYSELIKDGETVVRWNKFNADKDRNLDSLKEAMEIIAHQYDSNSTLVSKPQSISNELCNVIPFGDPHIGLFCHQAEVNDSFDTELAEHIMVSAVEHLVKSAPKADTALIINLGDFFHADTAAGVTLRSGHKLDVDGKWPQILGIGLRTMQRCIDTALERHNNVVVMNTIGNHDDHSSQFLAVYLESYYRNNPRVKIKDATRVHQYHQFGKNLFGVTHGHTTKPMDLEGIMTRDCNDIWSSTHRRKWFVGHYHSQRVHDLRNCVVEYYRTLAAGDAWSVGSGYRSNRDMRLETWHKEYGLTGTSVFDPIMLT